MGWDGSEESIGDILGWIERSGMKKKGQNRRISGTVFSSQYWFHFNYMYHLINDLLLNNWMFLRQHLKCVIFIVSWSFQASINNKRMQNPNGWFQHIKNFWK